MTTKVCVEIEVDGSAVDAFEVINRVLDDGSFQEAIHDVAAHRGLRIKVLSALSGPAGRTPEAKKKSPEWQQLIADAEEAAKTAEGLAQDLRDAIRDAESEEELRGELGSHAEGTVQDILSLLDA